MSSLRFACLSALALLVARPALAQLDPGAVGAPPSADLPAHRVQRDADGRAWLASGLRLPTQGATPVERAMDGLRQLGGELEVDLAELTAPRVRVAHGLTIVRFGRELALASGRLPVRDAVVVVALDGAGRLRFAVDHSGPRHLAPNHAPVPPADALALQAAFGADSAGATILEQREVALDLGGELRRVREIDLGRRLHERFRVYLDREGVVVAHSLIRHNFGRVYEPNPPVALEMTSDVELFHLESDQFLTGTYVHAASCDPARASCEPVQRAEADVDGNFLYDPEEPAFDDAFAEVNTYHHVDSIARYFREVHGLELSCCDLGPHVDVVANYVERSGTAYDNAFYMPESCSRGPSCATLAFGQGANKDFGYDGDVAYHEYGHGVVAATSQFTIFKIDRFRGVFYDPGALNEATADYFAASATDDPKLADYFEGGGIGGAEGSLRNLAGDLVCPDDLFGESHQDGRIWGQALWSIREALGQDTTDALVFASLLATPGDADFVEASEMLVTTAEAFPGLAPADVEVVRAELERRGLADCDRIIPLADETSYTGFSGIGQITGGLGGGVTPLTYAVEIPADATRFKVQMSRFTVSGQYDLYFRVGDPPRFQTGRTPPLIADYSVSGAIEVILDESSELPLPRCQTLYISLVATDLLSRGESLYSIYTDLGTSGDPAAECPPPPAVDMGAPVADAGAPTDGSTSDASTMAMGDADDGCGCRVAGSGEGGSTGSRSGALLLVGLGLLLAQRRRTRSMRRSSVSKKTVASAG